MSRFGAGRAGEISVMAVAPKAWVVWASVPVKVAKRDSAVNWAGSAGSWAFAPRPSTGPPGGADPPDGHGTWVLTLPDGRRFTVRLDVVPTLECDHRHETPGYHPSDRLRHLVQVRDGTSHSRPATATLGNRTSNTPFRSKKVAERAPVMPGHAAAPVIE